LPLLEAGASLTTVGETEINTLGVTSLLP
jgi:hypothetical protein